MHNEDKQNPRLGKDYIHWIPCRFPQPHLFLSGDLEAWPHKIPLKLHSLLKSTKLQTPIKLPW